MHNKVFLWFSFVTFVVVCEGFGAASEFSQVAEKESKGKGTEGETKTGVISVMRLLIWIALFYNLLKLRKKVTNLPVKELSTFLLNTILTRGLAALLPMIFFSFETLSCFSVYSLTVKKVCRSSAAATFYLSLYLSGFLLQSIISKALPRTVQSNEYVKYEDLAGEEWRKDRR